MTMLKNYSVCLKESAALPCPFVNVNNTNSNRNAKLKPPQAVTILNFHLPMRSLEVKNRTSSEDIKCLKLITAIKTPYLPDGRFDLEAYDDLVNMQIDNGAEVNCFGGKIKVIGNTGSNSTREAIHATEQGFAVGMHTALHIYPYYGNVPSRTGQDIPPQVIHTVAHSENLAGVKECMGNARIKQYTDKGIVVWSGNDDECHDSRWQYGVNSCIWLQAFNVEGAMCNVLG